MARSHHRPKKHHPQQHQHAGTRKTQRKITPIMTVFIGLIGLGIAYFATGADTTALIIGALVGMIAGWLIGRGMDKQVK